MNPELESKVLCREIGKLAGFFGGIGARWAAKKLPSCAHEETIEFVEDASKVMEITKNILDELGQPVPEFLGNFAAGELTALVGSGHMNLNPTLVFVKILQEPKGTTFNLRAVAKEGAIKQASAEKAVYRIREALEKNLA